MGNHHPAKDIGVQAHLHGLLQAIPPQGEVLVGHVLVSLVLHLTDVMEAVKVLRLRPDDVPNSPHDFPEAVFEMKLFTLSYISPPSCNEYKEDYH